MKPITYTLTPPTCTSETYYQTVEGLAKEVIEITSQFFRPITAAYLSSERRTISVDQVCLELLLLGVYARRGLPPHKHPTMAHLNDVLDCLEQSDDYTYQIQRLREWQMFINHQPSAYWDSICEGAHWFDKRSRAVLGPYTQQVEHFLSKYRFTGSDEDDVLFHTSPRIEYHINMVGAEILNRVLRTEFMSAEERLVVLPGCLRSNPQDCQASKWNLGFQCQHCTVGCQISDITRLGVEHDFQVSFVVHQSSLVSQVEGLKALGQKCEFGILGIACVLSLLEGGFLLAAHQVPAQCVPLDYSGCIHWYKEGIPTCVSIHRLLERVSYKQRQMR